MRRTSFAVIFAFVLLAAFLAVGVASAAVPTDSANLRNAVTVAGIMKHENALQKIADENAGTRAASTPGYDASVKYVADKLRRAGLTVTEQQFQFPFFE